MSESALAIIAGLKRRGLKVIAFDPVAMPKASGLPQMKGVTFANDPYDAARGLPSGERTGTPYIFPTSGGGPRPIEGESSWV